MIGRLGRKRKYDGVALPLPHQPFQVSQLLFPSLHRFCLLKMSDSVDPTVHPTTFQNACILHAPSFEGLAEQIELIKEQFDLQSTLASQYLLVINIPQPLFSKLENQPNLFKNVRATLFQTRSQVLYKIVGGVQHNQMIALFHEGLYNKLRDMGLSSFTGDFLFRNAARTRGLIDTKEPDLWFGPNNVHVNGGGRGFPSLVLEVGVSESTPQLQNDARWWYANSNGQTRLVMLIHANGNSSSAWAVDVEVWTEVLDPSSHITCNRPATSLECTQRARFENGVVTGAPLTLDFEMLMRRPPANPLEGNVVLDAGWIRTVCVEVGP